MPDKGDLRPAFVITGLDTGGAERVLLRLLEHSRWRSSAIVISLRQPGDLAPEFKNSGIDVRSLGVRDSLSSVVGLLRLIQLLRSHQPTIVSTWMYHADLFGGLAARIAGVPVVWGVRNNTLHREGTPWSTRVVVRLCAILSRWIPSRIICCSENARRTHVALGYRASIFSVVPNGVDASRFRPNPTSRASLRAELNVPADSRLVGMVARFDPQKDHVTFLKAAAAVATVMPNVHFLLVGPCVDSRNAILTGVIESLGLSERVRLLGLRADISSLLPGLDVHVLSSVGESFPSVLIEAMACGVPCVATNVGDAAQILGGTGIVVEPQAPDALAEAIVQLLTEAWPQAQARATACRERVLRLYTLEQMCERFEREFLQTVRVF